MIQSRAAEAYRLNQLELAVNAARPVELVVMLYDGAIQSTRRAIHAIASGDVPTKAAEVSRATNILSELAGVLDLEQGEVAINLANLYDFMRWQLLQANLRNSTERLEEVAGLLSQLRESWQTLAQRQSTERRQVTLGEPLAARAG
jgi:flagellar protein FliS